MSFVVPTPSQPFTVRVIMRLVLKRWVHTNLINLALSYCAIKDLQFFLFASYNKLRLFDKYGKMYITHVFEAMRPEDVAVYAVNKPVTSMYHFQDELLPSLHQEFCAHYHIPTEEDYGSLTGVHDRIANNPEYKNTMNRLAKEIYGTDAALWLGEIQDTQDVGWGLTARLLIPLNDLFVALSDLMPDVPTTAINVYTGEQVPFQLKYKQKY
jgi:hypothetical protein